MEDEHEIISNVPPRFDIISTEEGQSYGKLTCHLHITLEEVSLVFDPAPLYRYVAENALEVFKQVYVLRAQRRIAEEEAQGISGDENRWRQITKEEQDRVLDLAKHLRDEGLKYVELHLPVEIQGAINDVLARAVMLSLAATNPNLKKELDEYAKRRSRQEATFTKKVYGLRSGPKGNENRKLRKPMPKKTISARQHGRDQKLLEAAIALYVERDFLGRESKAELARHLGITLETLRRWLKSSRFGDFEELLSAANQHKKRQE